MPVTVIGTVPTEVFINTCSLKWKITNIILVIEINYFHCGVIESMVKV